MKIFKSLFVIFAMAVLVVGATGAVFSDTETVAGNTFAAGELELDVSGDSEAVEHYSFSNIKPGDCGGWSGFTCDYSGMHFEVENTGSLDGELSMSIENIVDTGDADLSTQLRPQVRVNGIWASESSNIGNLPVYHRNLAAGETITVDIAWSFIDAAGNEYQGTGTSFDVVFDLEQI